MKPKLKIWIDVDNSPHVPFFSPIIEELEKRGHSVFVTARDYAQTLELLRQLSIKHVLIGHHYGKKRLLKLLGLGVRTAQLIAFALNKQFSVAVSHGSRPLMLAAGMLRIPLVSMFDYEHSKGSFLYRIPSLYLIPEAIEDGDLPNNINPAKVMRYPGTKEYVYLSKFRPNGETFSRIGLDTRKVIALIRPPATDAHYHNTESEAILFAILDKISNADNTIAVILPRTAAQQEFMRKLIKRQARSDNLVILNEVFDGPDLIWSSDLVVSGGGTMNREAAALGVPAYSIFRGETAAVDISLADRGKINFVRSVDDARKIKLKKRLRSDVVVEDKALTNFIVDQIIALAEKKLVNVA